MKALKEGLGHADYMKYRFIVEAGKRARAKNSGHEVSKKEARASTDKLHQSEPGQPPKSEGGSVTDVDGGEQAEIYEGFDTDTGPRQPIKNEGGGGYVEIGPARDVDL
jgi:hypothetical protein